MYVIEPIFRNGEMVVYRRKNILAGERRYVVYCGYRALEEFRRKDSAIKRARKNREEAAFVIDEGEK